MRPTQVIDGAVYRNLNKGIQEIGLFDRKIKTEEDTFAASPVGLARAAKSSGQSILQITIPIRSADAKRGLTGGVFFTDSEDGSLLETIENEGWALEHVSHVFQLNGSIKDTGFREGSERYAGEIVGVYIFRAGAPTLDKAGAGGLSKWRGPETALFLVWQKL